MQLTGTTAAENILRCATALYHSEGEGIMSRLYDIIRNPIYKFGKSFPFPEAYHFLANTTFLGANDSAGKPTENNIGDRSKIQRAIGTKSVSEERKAGKARKLVQITTTEQYSVGLADSVAGIEKYFSE